MKPQNVIIAAALIIILSSFLTGCNKAVDNNLAVSSQQSAVSSTTTSSKSMAPTPVKTSLEETAKKAKVAAKDVKLVLKSEKSDKKIKVTIALNNPKQKAITSVQNWLSYDPAKIKGVEVDVAKSAFTLNAPYANAFDNTNGLMKLGRSNPKAITDKEIHVAVVTFEVLKGKSAAIDAYDYRNDLTGHTSANVMIDGKPYNVLEKPSSPLLIINQ